MRGARLTLKNHRNSLAPCGVKARRAQRVVVCTNVHGPLHHPTACGSSHSVAGVKRWSLNRRAEDLGYVGGQVTVPRRRIESFTRSRDSD